MPEHALHKVDVGTRLLDRAIEMLIDRVDPISALVLGGTAEDILQGLLQLQGKPYVTARHKEVQGAAELMGVRPPERDPEVERSLVELIRHPFNWARHADRPHEPLVTAFDWHKEAVWVIDRAIDNLTALTGSRHPRADEVDDLLIKAADD